MYKFLERSYIIHSINVVCYLGSWVNSISIQDFGAIFYEHSALHHVCVTIFKALAYLRILPNSPSLSIERQRHLSAFIQKSCHMEISLRLTRRFIRPLVHNVWIRTYVNRMTNLTSEQRSRIYGRSCHIGGKVRGGWRRRWSKGKMDIRSCRTRRQLSISCSPCAECASGVATDYP